MAPNKLEDHIKDKLEKREIEPSHASWQRLDARLDNDMQSVKFHRFKRIAIAVVVVMALGYGATYWFQFNETRTEGQMVEQPVEIQQETKKPIYESPSEDLFIIKKESSKPESKLVEDVSGTAKAETHIIQPDSSPTKKNQLTQNETKEYQPENSLLFEEQKLKEVVAQVTAIQNENGVVTEAEVDSLLKEAQRAIFLNKLKTQNNYSISATDLLTEVEDELNPSFKEKVYDFLKSGLITIKTAVADRKQ